jgi:8-oxo-dGTP pyrophosphatase MutT (NUDIX family)
MSIPVFPASTVVVLRDAEGGGLEVYMVRRPAQSSFLADADVFPGGRVEPDDHDEAWATLASPSPSGHRPNEVAAVRELFEEAGLLLARSAATGSLVDFGSGADATALAVRSALIDGSRRFSDVCAEAGWRLALDLLTPCSRWVTPHLERRRFDTMFYVTRAPAGQTATVDGQEAVAGRWVRPAVAVAEHADGRILLVPPTLKTLVDLADAPDVAAALTATAAQPLRTYAPRVFIEAGARYVLMHGDALYPAPGGEARRGPTRYRLDGRVWRAE